MAWPFRLGFPSPVACATRRGNYCNGLGYGPKDTDIASIILQPQIAGISLAYGQTTQVQSPSAFTCKGNAASIGTSQLNYGTSNNQLADISPSGQLCAGTWNRNTGGGIADYTYCYCPNPLPSSKGLPYAVAYVTATADSVTSNPVPVYIHAPVTAISLVTTSLSSSSPQQCFSQNQQAQLDAQACYVSNGTQYEFCAPPTVSPANYVCTGGLRSGRHFGPQLRILHRHPQFLGQQFIRRHLQLHHRGPDRPAARHHFHHRHHRAIGIVGWLLLHLPARIHQSHAGQRSHQRRRHAGRLAKPHHYRPRHVGQSHLRLEPLNTSPPIPLTSAATGGGTITAAFPGVGSIYAVCEPPSCNPAPINEFGLNGTGLSLSSNPVSITVPGTTSEFVWFAAPGQSQYFASMELLTGNPGSTVRLPFVPNSMVMDQDGNNLYFGSARELMIYSTASNSLTNQNTSVPGVVLAVSPNNSELVINDQIRGVFYLYNTSSGAGSSYGGLGVAAQWTPDSNTLYIVDSAAAGAGHTNTLYVYNINLGWSTYPSAPPPAVLRTWPLRFPASAHISPAFQPSPTPGAPPARSATTPAFSSIRKAIPSICRPAFWAPQAMGSTFSALRSAAAASRSTTSDSPFPADSACALKPPPARRPIRWRP